MTMKLLTGTLNHKTNKWTKQVGQARLLSKWDSNYYYMQGVELRAFKSVLLGQKSCEIKDLFSANPQLMTVSINVNGSLKLSIIITWK